MSSMMRGNLRMAMSGVRGSKWRSILTMLGIIVGIVSVVTVVGIGEGVKRQITGTLNHYGKDLIVIQPGRPDDTSPTAVRDAELVEKTPDVKLSSPLGVVSGTVRVGNETFEPTVLAVGADAAELLKQPIAYGEFWSDKDLEETGQVAVIGRHVADKLFDEPVPLGRSFTFRGQTFIVRGIFSPFAAVPFSPTASFDNAIFIPYQTAAELSHDNAGIYALLARPDKPENLKPAIGNITDRLRNEHGGAKDFTVLESSETLNTGGETIRLLTIWICAVAAISLFIGGVGIMNIMLLTVTERMHEIGVRKAIGATSRQILMQFLLEATVLSVLGGAIGIVLSLGVQGLLHAYTDLKPVISWQAIAIATGVSVAIGIVFGVAPAAKAASKDPIDALRHE